MSLLWYSLYILIVLAFTYLSEHTKYKTAFLAFSFLVCVSFYIIRFDVGPDYIGYVRAFKTYADGGEILWDSDYTLWGILSKIFSWTDRGYIFVFGIYGVITQVFLFYTLKHRGVLFGGLFLFYTLGFFFHSLDQVRQFAAISIFLYSIRYIEKHSFFNFFLISIILFFVHHSVIICMLLYPLYNRTRLSKYYIAIPVFSFLLILYFHQVFNSLWNKLYYMAAFVYPNYIDSIYSTTAGDYKTGLGHLFISTIGIFCVLLTPQKYYIMRNMVFIGTILHIVAAGNLPLERLSLYYSIFVCITLPTVLRIKSLLIKVIVAMFCVIYWCKNVGRSNFEFKTIFSNEFAIEYFEPRNDL